jgi:RimJ/RimL family protein N-acetyltransferase
VRPRILRGPRLDAPLRMTEPVRTERLMIRPYTADDLDDYADIQRRPDVVEYMFWPLRDREASKRHLAARRRQTRLEQSHDFLGLAVELPDEPSLNPRPGSGRVIGDVSLLLRNAPSRQLEVGWVMNPDFAGRGYATEASRAGARAPTASWRSSMPATPRPRAWPSASACAARGSSARSTS